MSESEKLFFPQLLYTIRQLKNFGFIDKSHFCFFQLYLMYSGLFTLHCFFGLASGHGSHLHALIVLTKKGESVEVCLHRICGASGTLYIQTTFRTTCCPQFYLRRTASVKRLRLARCSLLSFFSSNLKHQFSRVTNLSDFDISC